MTKTIDTYTVKGIDAVLALAHLTLHRERDGEEANHHLIKAIETLTRAIKDSCDTEGEFLATTAFAYGVAYGSFRKKLNA